MEMAATIIVSCREAQKATTITQGVFSLGVMSPKPMVAVREARNRITLVTQPERFFFLCGRKCSSPSLHLLAYHTIIRIIPIEERI